MTALPNHAPCWSEFELHTTEEMLRALGELLDQLRHHGNSEREVFGIRLALEEAIVNAIRHGHGYDPAKTVRFRYLLAPEGLHAEVCDEGPGFDPDRLPDPLALENLERPGGRGVFLMRHYMTHVQYDPPGNRVSLFKASAPANERTTLSAFD